MFSSLIFIIFLLGIIFIIISLTNRCDIKIPITKFISEDLDLLDYDNIDIDLVFDFIFKKQEPWLNKDRADIKKFINLI